MATVFFSVAFRDGDEHVRIMADSEVVAELTPVQAKALVTELLVELSLHSDVMDEVTAPPCQNYSTAGRRKGEGS